MPRLAVFSGNASESRRMLGRLLGESESLAISGRAGGNGAMHVEVAFDFTTLFLKKHRKKETGPEHFPESRKDSCARAWLEIRGRVTVLPKQVPPDDNVAVFHLSKPRINVLF